MDNLSIIINGYKNYVFPNKKIKQLAEARAKICSKCDFTTNALITLPDKTEVKGLKCTKCTCPNLSVVVMSENKKCPINKW
jgi:hypothetical protein